MDWRFVLIGLIVGIVLASIRKWEINEINKSNCCRNGSGI